MASLSLTRTRIILRQAQCRAAWSVAAFELPVALSSGRAGSTTTASAVAWSRILMAQLGTQLATPYHASVPGISFKGTT